MITRSQVRLDYKQLHTTGVRVPKMEIEAGMADLNKMKLDEEVIVEDINHTLTLYALNDLTDIRSYYGERGSGGCIYGL